MSLSEGLLFVHIVAAMAWLGGGFLSAVLAMRMKAADPQHRLGFARTMQMMSAKVFMPASILVLAMGIVMVLQDDAHRFEQVWIAISLAIVASIAAMGPLFFKPTIRKAIAAMESGNGAAAAPLMRRIGLGSRIALLLEFVALWAMVFKPGL